MGLQKTAIVRLNDLAAEAQVLFESDHIRIGKPFSRSVAGADLRSAFADGDDLVVPGEAGGLRLTLPSGQAAAILARLKNPRSRAQKLGLKQGQTVLVLGLDDPALMAECAAAGAATIDARFCGSERPDLVFLGANRQNDLAELENLARAAPDAAIWVVSFKGKRLTLRDVEVMAAADAQGYVSTKVVAFDADRTALRLVRRKRV